MKLLEDVSHEQEKSVRIFKRTYCIMPFYKVLILFLGCRRIGFQA